MVILSPGFSLTGEVRQERRMEKEEAEDMWACEGKGEEGEGVVGIQDSPREVPLQLAFGPSHRGSNGLSVCRVLQ